MAPPSLTMYVFDLYSQLSQEPSADFSGTEQEQENEKGKEKEHGEAIKGPPPGGV